ncbi:MAG: hypothetical protein IJ287_08195 [Methanobrevibacter sp.]|nr:hypothetical protein [Methanobrevibacter sp.]
MQGKNKIILIAVILLITGSLLYFGFSMKNEISISSSMLANTDTGTVEKFIYGNASANNTIALITGIHPREPLSIDPEIKAAKEYVRDHEDVKIIHYRVTVTKDPQDYEKGRYNGEHLVHDYINPDVTSSDADCVIISHSHIPTYGEGFYVATPEMDDESVDISNKIKDSSDFNYYPKTGNETYRSTSAQLVSCPIAQAGYPTFVYEIPEDITEQDSTNKAKELFDMMVEFACN